MSTANFKEAIPNISAGLAVKLLHEFYLQKNMLHEFLQFIIHSSNLTNVHSQFELETPQTGLPPRGASTFFMILGGR